MQTTFRLLEACILCAVLLNLWAYGSPLYAGALSSLVHAMSQHLGLPEVDVAARSARFVNVVPFVVLVLLTPGLAVRRRIFGFVGGVLVIACVHVAFVYALDVLTDADPVAPGSPTGGGAPGLVVLTLLVFDAAPLMIWVAIAREPINRWLQRFQRRDALGA